MAKQVILRLLKGTLQEGYPAILHITDDSNSTGSKTEIEGRLPPEPNISKLYSNWKAGYCHLPGLRRSFTPTELPRDIPCSKSAENLITTLNNWLNSGDPDWQKIRDCLQQNITRNDEIRLIVQTEDPQLRQLPWNAWDLFNNPPRYPNAEIALGVSNYALPPNRKLPQTDQARILVILGDKTGNENQKEISPDRDLELLKHHLPDAEIVPLIEPTAEEFRRHLWDKTGWHILFYSGHSDSDISQKGGKLQLNPSETLEIRELKNALSQAIENGLQLAIFNSCTGLGLAKQLEELLLPQIIVMRERILDTSAQQFLDYFLTAFSKNNSLYASVREARLKLEDTTNKRYPGTNWLPVIVQNPAITPPTWREFFKWRCTHTLRSHTDIVKSVAISPNNKILATGSLDKTIKIWDLTSGQLIETIAGHNHSVMAVAISPDSKILASSCNMAFNDGTIKLWDLDTYKLRQTLENSLATFRVNSLAFSPDGQYLASTHISPYIFSNPTIKFWHLPTGKARISLKGHGWEVNSLAFSKDGYYLISGGFDGAINIWNWRSEKLLKTLNRPSPSEPVEALVSHFDTSVGTIQTIAISPDGKTFAGAGSDKRIMLWNIASGELERTLIQHQGTIYALAFHPDGKTLASGSTDNTICIWNYHTGQLIQTLTHQGPVRSLAFSSDGTTLVSGSEDQTVKIWRMPA